MTTYEIPLEVFDQHSAIVGKVGSGKTVTAKGGVERLIASNRKVCIIDPTGAWWGLKSSADGKKAGYPVLIFGGEHADVPINEHSGAALAGFIAGNAVPVIIDLSQFLTGQKHRFAVQLFSKLFVLNHGPLHLIVDEADEFAPQKPLKDALVMLHHFDRIVRRGRVKGFRVMMITQRPAVLNKDVLTQANTLIAMRLVGPQDRAAIDAWIRDQADPAKGREVMSSLSKLKVGEGWIWAPEAELLKRAQFPMNRTYDSSKAPEVDDELESLEFARVDVEAVRELFAAEEEEARENDPKALRKRNRELEDLLDKATRNVISVPVEDTEGRRESYRRGKEDGYKDGWAAAMKDAANVRGVAERIDKDLLRLEKGIQDFIRAAGLQQMDGVGSAIQESRGTPSEEPDRGQTALPSEQGVLQRKATAKPTAPPGMVPVHQADSRLRTMRGESSRLSGFSPSDRQGSGNGENGRLRSVEEAHSGGNSEVSGAMRQLPQETPRGGKGSAVGSKPPSAALKLTAALAQAAPGKFTWGQAATLAGLKPRGGHFNEGRKYMREHGWVLEEGDLVSATASGLAMAGDLPPAPKTAAERVAMWKSKLPAPAPEILGFLVDNWPGVYRMEEIAKALDKKPVGGHWNSGMAVLRNNGLIVKCGINWTIPELLHD